MPMGKGGAGLGSGGGIAVPSEQVFTSNAERDTYFTNNPSKLVDGAQCIVLTNPPEGLLQQYVEVEWQDRSAVVQGRQGEQGLQGEQGDHVDSAEFVGDDIVFGDTGGRTFNLVDAVNTLKGDQGDAAPTVQFEFSAQVDGPWVDQATYQLNPNAYQYWRQSNDGGETWTPGVRVRASVQDLPDGYGWFSDGAGALQLQKDGQVILNITPEQVTSETLRVLNGKINFGASKSQYDGVENVIFQNNVTGATFHPVWQNADNGSWRGFVRTKGDEYTRVNYLGGFVDADSAFVDSTLTLNVTFDQRIYAFYVSSAAIQPNCTLQITQGGKNKLTLEGLNLSAGENRIVFANTQLGQPFIDVLNGQTYVVRIFDADGQLFDVRVEQGGTTAWWAIDTTAFEDKEVLDAGSAGDGLQFDDTERKIALQAASTDQLGGVKVGVGLAMQPDGTLYSTVSGSIVTAVADEAGRLALPQIAQAYTCIQSDIEQIFYLNASTDPSDPTNWIEGGSTSAAVQGFKGAGDSTPREGIIEATRGDYTQSLVPATDETTGTKYVFVIDNGELFLEEI